MISIRNLNRYYGKVAAVSNVSVDINRGEIVGLLGHNGAGKTTVMKVLTGFLDPTSGTVTVGGVDVTQDRTSVQRQIGYLPENAPLYTEMLVQEYLLMMAELRGVPQESRNQAVIDAAKATALVSHLAQPISSLSKGYRQRVGIAQAIVHSPDVLVLDAPPHGLDPTQIQVIRELIQRLAKSTTIILSTHILQEIEAVCDRVLIMIQGKIAADAPLEDLLASDVIRVKVKAEDDTVANRIRAVEGVRKLARVGTSGDYTEWTFEAATTADPIPEIVAVGVAAGWSFGGVAREHRTLETVFKQLQQEHVESQEVTA